MAEAQAKGKKAAGLVGKFLAAHIFGVPAPIVVGGAATLALLGYLYYRNKGQGVTGAQPVAVPVSSGPGAAPSGSSSGGGVDYSSQLGALETELTGLQSYLTGFGTQIGQLQSEQSALAAGLQGLTAQQSAAQAPPPSQLTSQPTYQPPSVQPYIPQTNYSQSQQTNLAPAAAANPAYTAWYNQNFLTNTTPISQTAPRQTPYFQPQPISNIYNPYGTNIPVYMPLPQYQGPINPIASQPYYSTNPSGSVPSSVFGSGSSAFSVGGHYVTYPNGQSIWVPG
jgi:hypothetical protein